MVLSTGFSQRVKTGLNYSPDFLRFQLEDFLDSKRSISSILREFFNAFKIIQALKKFLPSGRNLARFQLCLLFIPLPPFQEGITKLNFKLNEFRNPSQKFRIFRVRPETKGWRKWGENVETIANKFIRVIQTKRYEADLPDIGKD